jgi:BlaI family transcriptional regulator, penicillinase repressor
VKFRPPTDDIERAILAKLWELGAGSVRDLHDQLGQRERRALATTTKVVERLRKKGLIERHPSGDTSIYRPLLTREELEGACPRKAMRGLFGTAPHAPVAALVDEAEDVDPKLVDKLDRLVSARRRWKDGA